MGLVLLVGLVAREVQQALSLAPVQVLQHAASSRPQQSTSSAAARPHLTPSALWAQQVPRLAQQGGLQQQQQQRSPRGPSSSAVAAVA